MAISFFGGISLWTIAEYALHRWVFHLNTTGANVVTCTFHFLIHGLHHKVSVNHFRTVLEISIYNILFRTLGTIWSEPTSISSGASHINSFNFLRANSIAHNMSAYCIGRWSFGLSVLRYDPLLHSLWQPGRRIPVQSEALPLPTSFRSSRQGIRHQQSSMGRNVRNENHFAKT